MKDEAVDMIHNKGEKKRESEELREKVRGHMTTAYARTKEIFNNAAEKVKGAGEGVRDGLKSITKGEKENLPPGSGEGSPKAGGGSFETGSGSAGTRGT